MCARKVGSRSQGFLAETVETGDKNRDVSVRHACFVKKALERLARKMSNVLFQNGSVHEFYCLKVLITFGTSEYISCQKIRRIIALSKINFSGKAS